MRVILFRCSMALALLAGSATVWAQVTAADYQRAQGLRERYEAAALNVPGPATWIDKTTRIWYRVSVAGGHQFVVADAATGQKRPAFDHERLAATLSKLVGRSLKPVSLPFNTITFMNDEKAIEVRFDGSDWTCGLDDYVCTRTPVVSPWERQQPPPPCSPTPAGARPRVAPDGTLEAVIINYNIHVREKGARQTTPLTMDGSEDNCYELSSVVWSPDSKQVAAYRTSPGYRRLVHYVESSPEDQLQPKTSSRFYAKPGDTLDIDQPVIVDVASRRPVVIDNSLFPNPYDMSRLEWRSDSSAVTFEYNQRGHQVYRVIEADITGKARPVVSEEPKTFFTYSSKKYRHDVADGKEVIWMSERDGWNHLYLFDGTTGAITQQITKGDWVVRGVSKVDDQKRQIYFSASGKDTGQDPYFVHYYRINFDGTDLVRLTEGNVTHTVSFSADMAYFTDTYSRVDAATVLEIRRTADRSLVLGVERADISGLAKLGWTPPEVFVAKGRDGTTDIWGVIYRPALFDPRKKYPVIENIYAGPHSSFVPKTFMAYNQMQAQADLGFVVVQIDGMGTSNRSKAFHDVSWMNLKDAGFPDRILWHKAAAAKYPWYDATRVGVYGTSAGGQSSMGALLFHPEFYKAAVSAVGCHDNRMDKIWWNEQWMGWPIGPHYAESSNVDNAHRLQGKVLLVVGELDTNVDPSSTLQVVNALIKANKDFELLVIPGAGHGSGGTYGERRRFDFFVQHLLGQTPPDWNTK
ncbi:MAG: DPP IV N-terminal domain-containing protein [Vicinamibacterales bacterium]|nr:DPP IV N-terminal domain-containing protein [Vicinamibacterales bacterium]